jgi:hypothetical protein
MESYTEERQKEIVANFFNLLIDANDDSLKNADEYSVLLLHNWQQMQASGADLLELTQHLIELVAFKQSVIDEYRSIYSSMHESRKEMITRIQEIVAQMGN